MLKNENIVVLALRYDNVLSMRAMAARYNIPESSFRHRLSGRMKMKIGFTEGGRLLTDAEESVLVNYIKGSSKRAMPVTKRAVMGALEYILLKEQELMYTRNIKFQSVSSSHEKWWRGFKSRHPEIVFRTPETLTSDRKNISELLIRQRFSDVRSYFSERDLNAIYFLIFSFFYFFIFFDFLFF